MNDYTIAPLRHLLLITVLPEASICLMGCCSVDAQTASPEPRACTSYVATYTPERPNVLVRITPDLAESAHTTRIRAQDQHYRVNGRVQTRPTYWPLRVSIGSSAVASLVALGTRYGVSVSPAVAGETASDITVELTLRAPSIDFSQFPYRVHARLQYDVSYFDSSRKRLGLSHITGTGESVNPNLTRFARIEYGRAQSSDPRLYGMLNTAIDAALSDVFGKLLAQLSDPEWALNTLTSDTNRSSVEDTTLAGIRAFDTQNYRKARLYFQKALRKDQSFQPAAVYLGACYALTAEPSLATDVLRSAIAHDPGSDQAKQAQKWLDRLCRTASQ
jgi:hypothetical protein